MTKKVYFDKNNTKGGQSGERIDSAVSRQEFFLDKRINSKLLLLFLLLLLVIIIFCNHKNYKN